MQGVVLTRIDDRLIHGQVMTSWLNFTSANKIMVIDDQTAADPFMKTVLKCCSRQCWPRSIYSRKGSRKA